VIVELLAIRAAWDWLLHGDAEQGALDPAWQVAWSNAELHADRLRAAQEIDWLLQDALEIAYRQPLAERLLEATREPAQAPKVQAVFCIDVRSEVFRRNLESAAPHVHTRGFAGFFGLPIAYSPLGSALTRPQLPGLLSPAVCVTETCDSADHAHALEAKRRGALQSRQRWSEFRTAGSSTFSFVESLGITYGAKLLKDSLASTAAAGRWEDTGLPASAAAQLRPRLPQVPSDPRGAAVTAKAVLQAMGLVRGFAPLVLLAGHGSQSANNPHASGLDCGACCGQTGEVNARALADLLNAPAVRAALREAGVDVPDGTHFLPGLHNTTTDEVVLYDVDAVPAALRPNLAELQAWLAEAGRRARAERAPTLGLGKLAGDAAALEQAIRERSNDWAQVRPEWGLADNAAFVVAPRARTRHLNLGGRSFLHDYDHREDPGLGTLELILTAPMVVINWINMQYHASTVDNRRYGSGNKVLHNVVGGHIGVFEGNGGDLRIGLPMQSLHDGRTWRHTPLRMNVFVEAPRAAIETIAAKHPVVRNLVDNGWLHLMRIDPDRPLIERFRHGAWTTLAVH
jgi:uncharacterized protein YbcC (UPF0753/DUF2309 family)